tara:strand:+ start:536 stop:1702 length:1167 start_codon:yes stop_codon:yes gene_type:complete
MNDLTKTNNFNIQSLIKILKDNFIILILSVIVFLFFFIYNYFQTEPTFQSKIRIYPTVELQNNLNVSNLVNNSKYDFTAKKLFDYYITNIQKESLILNVVNEYRDKNKTVLDENIASSFNFINRTDYFTITFETNDKDFSKSFLIYFIQKTILESIEDLIKQINDDLEYEALLLDRLYDVELSNLKAQQENRSKKFYNLRESENTQKELILSLLDQNIKTAESMNWIKPQTEIIAALRNEKENTFLINENDAINIFLSNKFFNYPVYLFGVDLLQTIRDNVEDYSLQEISKLVFNSEQKTNDLPQSKGSVFNKEFETNLATNELVTDFIKSQFQANEFNIINYSVNTIETKKMNYSLLFYVIISLILGVIATFVIVFLKDSSITFSNK